MSKKQRHEKLPPVTAETVARLIDSAEPGWYDRKSIADALGRKKTSHVIRVIDAAAELGLIVREYWTLPGIDRYKAVYASNHLLTLDAQFDHVPPRPF